MKRNSTSAVGALHPVLFMLLVYIISVVLAFFVCRIIYFSLHGDAASVNTSIEKSEPMTVSR
ncbi:MAG TPA: hypothetical protein VM884_02305 [Flavisolibacter sp.]|jgi:hypothetical protein|nr:hypothetical protein [Flavisolibacter sp.]